MPATRRKEIFSSRFSPACPPSRDSNQNPYDSAAAAQCTAWNTHLVGVRGLNTTFSPHSHISRCAQVEHAYRHLSGCAPVEHCSVSAVRDLSLLPEGTSARLARGNRDRLGLLQLSQQTIKDSITGNVAFAPYAQDASRTAASLCRDMRPCGTFASFCFPKAHKLDEEHPFCDCARVEQGLPTLNIALLAEGASSRCGNTFRGEDNGCGWRLCWSKGETCCEKPKDVNMHY